ncbi:MAG: PAS domain S-box protein [Rhodocyclaceae bacterium]|nr:PAS domain S-box protein [Rhodocyclaceae bacterium]
MTTIVPGVARSEPRPSSPASSIALVESFLGMAALLHSDGRVEAVNRELAAVSGAGDADVEGRCFWECEWWAFDPNVQTRIRRAVEAAASAGQAQFLRAVKRVRDREFLNVEIKISPFECPSGGGNWLIYSARDRTAQVAGEEALALSEQRFRLAVESFPDGLVMVDQKARMVLVNAGMETLFGYARDELLGARIDQLLPDTQRHGHAAHFARYMEHPTARAMANRRELHARRKDGSEFQVEIGLNPIPSEQGTMVLATIQDVTARYAARRSTERALEEKTVLLHEIHHRVKNNLQVISSLLNLQSRGASGDVAAALAESQGRIKAMALIHQLLYERKDFSSVDIAEYLRRLCGLLSESYRSVRPRFRFVLEAEEGVCVSLKRAVPCGLLVNELVTNALKHAFPEPRTGQVLVSLQRDDDGFTITVADDGIGLPPEVVPGVTRSLGMQLIPLLSDQACGSWALTRDNGTRFTIRIRPDEGKEVA